MNYIYVLICSIISVLILWYYYRSFFAPAVWLQSLWTFYILLSVFLAIYVFELPANTTGLYFIIFINWSFAIGCLLTSFIMKSYYSNGIVSNNIFNISILNYNDKIFIDGKYIINDSYIRWFMIGVLLLSSLGIILQLKESGVTLSGMSLTNIQAITTNLRYIEQYTPPAYQRYLAYFAYIGTYFAGMIYPFISNKKTKFWCLTPLALLLLKSVIFTARFGTLASFLIFISGVISTNIYVYRSRIFFKKYIFRFIIGFGLLFVYSFYVQISRFSGSEIDMAVNMSRTLSMFAPLIGFLAWFPNYNPEESLKFGARTFEGLYELIGLNVREFGQYTDTVGLENLETSNIYTVYRGLIEDFSIIGTIIIYMLLGLVVQYLYLKVVRGRVKLIPVLAIFYVYVLISFVISIFSHNSLLFSFILGLILWRVMFLRISHGNIFAYKKLDNH